MNVMKLWISLLLLVGPGLAWADEADRACYYFWQAQCFEIRDAARRDITHHVFVTRGPRAFRAPAEQRCEDALANKLDGTREAALLAQFRKRMKKVDSCPELTKLKVRVQDNGEAVLERYRRLTRESKHKELHEIDPPKL
jgi:hypothetical protein